MAYVKIWLHVVWTTKNRKPLLQKSIRQSVFDHIKENALMKDIYLDFINGHFDHVHCLISLKADQAISKVVQLIKGEASFWINQQKLVENKFGWQDEYFVVSVSESHVNRVRNYIKNQEEHHRNKTFQEEYEEFMNRYGLERVSG
ncbi:MAG: IS200/IS605 family transposase [Fulvivirga sp.]